MIHSKNFNKQDTKKYKYRKWVIHFKFGEDLNSIKEGSILRVDLYNKAKITAIKELSRFKLEEFQEGHVDLNGTREVNYFKIGGICNDTN